MATYGEIRFRLSKMAPGTDLDILDGLIQDRYEEILDRLDWDRQMITSTLQTEAEYATGTLSATNGLTLISGSGTDWAAGHTGRMLRVAEQPQFYGFTQTSATAATLERAYEDDTVSGAAYRINRNVYTLPADVRKVVSVQSFELGTDLRRVTQAELNQIAPRRDSYGVPEYWAPYMDALTDPPVLQLELYPVPIGVAGFRYEAFTDVERPTWSTVSLLPWVRPAALIQGVLSDVRRTEGAVAQADSHERRFAELVANMATIAARRSGPVTMRASGWVREHEVRRYTR